MEGEDPAVSSCAPPLPMAAAREKEDPQQTPNEALTPAIATFVSLCLSKKDTHHQEHSLKQEVAATCFKSHKLAVVKLNPISLGGKEGSNLLPGHDFSGKGAAMDLLTTGEYLEYKHCWKQLYLNSQSANSPKRNSLPFASVGEP